MNRGKQHQWATFYSPRNGRISIQACSRCGVAKSFVLEGNKCQDVSEQEVATRLRGWSMDGQSGADNTIRVG